VVVLAPFAMVPLLIAGVAWMLSDPVPGTAADRGAPRPVPCAEALAFGGARLPDGARAVGPCETRAGIDRHYSASFRMPLPGVRDWLTRSYPGAGEPVASYCSEGADLCLDAGLDRGGLPPGTDAHAVRVNVVYEDGGTALVRFTAFTM
jgi:hypothetical protein